MSTIARTAAGTPVASTATGGPPGPPHARAPATTSSASVQVSVSAPERAGQLQPALLQVDDQHLGAALAARPAPRTGRSARRRAPPRARRARSAPGAPRAPRSRPARPSPPRRASAAAIGNTWSWPVHSRPCRPPSTWIPISSKLSHVLVRARRCTGSSARRRAAATAPPAGRRASPGRQSAPSAAIVRADLVALDAGELAAARGRRTARRRRSGSPSRRCRPPRAPPAPRRARDRAARAARAPPSTRRARSPRRASATSARPGHQPHTSAAVSTISSSLADLLLVGDRVALDGRGEAALGREAQLLDRHEPRGLLDPPLELVLATPARRAWSSPARAPPSCPGPRTAAAQSRPSGRRRTRGRSRRRRDRRTASRRRSRSRPRRPTRSGSCPGTGGW